MSFLVFFFFLSAKSIPTAGARLLGCLFPLPALLFSSPPSLFLQQLLESFSFLKQFEVPNSLSIERDFCFLAHWYRTKASEESHRISFALEFFCIFFLHRIFSHLDYKISDMGFRKDWSRRLFWKSIVSALIFMHAFCARLNICCWCGWTLDMLTVNVALCLTLLGTHHLRSSFFSESQAGIVKKRTLWLAHKIMHIFSQVLCCNL